VFNDTNKNINISDITVKGGDENLFYYENFKIDSHNWYVNEIKDIFHLEYVELNYTINEESISYSENFKIKDINLIHSNLLRIE